MPSKDLHDKPFGDETLLKLRIFEDYTGEWIPAFVMQGTSPVFICDFFAGTGYDKNGVPGSPIRILKKIEGQLGNILNKDVKIVFHVNEKDPQKFELVQKSCEEYLNKSTELRRAIEIHYYNEDFETLFETLKNSISQNPSLLLLDQNGVKFLSSKYLLALEQMRRVDFLYFSSSGYLVRFGDLPEFKKHIEIDLSEVRNSSYKFVHRNFIKALKKLLTSSTELKLHPFSIKKGSNIYGIIFGATHRLAVDKFLDIAWKIDPNSGDANFDIDDAESKKQGDLFETKLTKVEAFQQNVRSKVLSGEITNNSEAYDYSHSEGHPGRHASEAVLKMKKDREITFEGVSPLITYEQIYRKNRIVKFEVLTK